MYSRTTFSGRAVRKLAPFPPLSPSPPLRLYTREASFCCSSPRQRNGTWPKTGSVRFRIVPFRSVLYDTDQGHGYCTNSISSLSNFWQVLFRCMYIHIHENRPIVRLKDATIWRSLCQMYDWLIFLLYVALYESVWTCLNWFFID